ncbi:dynamin family protein [Bacillus sp. B1-b2]|uniref:dynamin family protein n=1 Tax=Bacillus sp. B1-b2 TaxID=2653201 RepID=UPI00186A03BE|nr:dynamin family protein [Bacillus sp. B1-b2]
MSNYMNLQDFEYKKQQALFFLQEVLDIANELKVREVSQYLMESIRQLENQSFTLTVVGEFSRGKSTFINALLGKNVLPSKVKPTTTMINRIFYEETPSFSLSFRNQDEPRKILEESDFRKLCAPREPDEEDLEDIQRYQEELQYFKKISMAEIGYPNHFCESGVEIYDTPGTNDIDETREEITFSFVPKSDAVVFLLSATTPFGASEMEFLQDRILSEHINKVFFVVNFKDRLLKTEDEKKVMNYIREKLELLIPEPRLYLVSSMDALTIRRLEQGENFKVKTQRYNKMEDTGFFELEKDLYYFFQFEKGHAKLEKPLRRLIKKIDDLLTDSIALRVSASEMEIEEINHKIAELDPKITQFKYHAQGIINRLLENLQSEEDVLIREVESQLRVMIESIVLSLDTYSGSLEDAEIKAFLNKQASTQKNNIQVNLNQIKSKIIEEHVTNAYKLLNSEEQELNKAVKSAFNLELEMNHNFDLSLYESKDDMFGLVMGAAGFGIGALIFAPALIVIGGIGAALGAFFFGDSIAETVTTYRRNQKINELKKQVKQSLYDSRSNITGQFRVEWKNIINKIELVFEEEVNEKTLNLQTELHQVRLEKEVEKRSVEEQKKYLEDLSNQLKKNRKNAINLINQTRGDIDGYL